MNSNNVTWSFSKERKIAVGTFAQVYMSTIAESGDIVAVKKQTQNKKFKNRELAILKEMDHTNVIKMQHAFFTSGEYRPEDSVLNIVMDYIPMTVYRINESFKKLNQPIHPILLKLYAYQLLRGLAYIHAQGVIHRDIKPQNLLIDPTCHVLKICDFGSAKKYNAEDSSVAYITSRYYRAPELIFGSTKYDYSIDVWSAGCVIAEMIAGKPLFQGENAHAQVIEIIKKIGTPTEDDVTDMNPDYQNKQLPKVIGLGFLQALNPDGKWEADQQAIDLVTQLLKYSPKKRINLFKAMAHPFFNELRQNDLILPNGNCIPDLFNFTLREKELMGGEGRDILIPSWYDPEKSPCIHQVDIQQLNVLEEELRRNQKF